MRGSHRQADAELQSVGIIPAHAGLTSEPFPRSVRRRDHPRACGAHDTSHGGKIICMGSSPRMRGSLSSVYLTILLSGIIPAHAGLTRHEIQQLPTCRDHPRACGAHFLSRPCRLRMRGSSPRMRGSRFEGTAADLHAGIIPAHAGLTRSSSSPWTAGWDHPRACGAHLAAGKVHDLDRGSSPRMRGSLKVI